jgi:hypothetical protein
MALFAVSLFAYSGFAITEQSPQPLTNEEVKQVEETYARKKLVRRVMSQSVDAAALVAKKEKEVTQGSETEVEINAQGESEVTQTGEAEVGAAEVLMVAGEARSEYNIFREKAGVQMKFRSVTVNADASGFGLFCEEEYNSGYSRPGSPHLQNLAIEIDENDDAVSAHGDRLVKAADAADAMKACESFFSFGDYTWCNKAMPAESEYARRNVWGGKSCNVTGVAPGQLLETASRRALNMGQYTGLSFGIEELDPWSELMSSMYFLHTRLFDCYVSGKNGPMPNDWHGTHDREHECKETRCYTEPYEVTRECLSNKEKKEGKRTFKTLNAYLNGRAPLSTYVKMDIEGSEWHVLQDLLNNDEDMAKIRTLDMEVHLTMSAGEDQMPMETRVSVMEKLAQKFSVTGSTIQLVAESVHDEFKKLRKADPTWKKRAELPHTSGGLPLNQYCISFVNRALL